jgi:hypothetical protein
MPRMLGRSINGHRPLPIHTHAEHMNALPAFFLVLYLGMPPVTSLTPFATAEDCANALHLVVRSFPGSAKGGCIDTNSLLNGLDAMPPPPQGSPIFPPIRGAEPLTERH